MRALSDLTRQAAETAELLKRKGYPDDAHKLRNVAQAARSRRCLMAQTFAIEDGREVRGA